MVALLVLLTIVGFLLVDSLGEMLEVRRRAARERSKEPRRVSALFGVKLGSSPQEPSAVIPKS